LKEVTDYKSEFLDLKGGKKACRAMNKEKFLREAEAMARVRDTHESQHPFRSDGFDTQMGELNFRNGLEAPEYKHKRVLDPEDVQKVRQDTYDYT
jgi:hypothetical protein